MNYLLLLIRAPLSVPERDDYMLARIKLFERYDWNIDGFVNFEGEVGRLLEDRRIVQDLDKRTLETLYLHLRQRYDLNGDDLMSPLELKRLAKDLHGSEVNRNGVKYKVSPEAHFRAGLTAHEQTNLGYRDDDYEEAFARFQKSARNGHPGGQVSEFPFGDQIITLWIFVR